MGNYKFRLADMMPNAWFFKLRDMSKKKSSNNNNTKPKINHRIIQNQDQKIITSSEKKTNSKKNTNNCSHEHVNQFPCQRSPRKSYYFTRELVGSDSPRRLSTAAKKTKKKKKRLSVSESPTTPKPEIAVHDSVWISPPEYSSSSSRSDGIGILAETAVSVEKKEREADDVDSFSRLTLAPIATKAKKKKERKGIIVNDLARKLSSAGDSTGTGSPGIRLRRLNNSPRIALSRKSFSSSEKKKKTTTTRLSESFAVVKSSFDPQRDFRESMIEMIVENEIRSSKELEDLLACYLSLNSDEYHGLIIKVFKQIWFDITN